MLDSFDTKWAVKCSFSVPCPSPKKKEKEKEISLPFVRKFCLTDAKGIKAPKSKKKNRRRKDHQKNASADESIESPEKV